MPVSMLGLGSGIQIADIAVELREDVVPDFQMTVAFAECRVQDARAARPLALIESG